MRLTQTLRQTPRVSPQLVMANELLQFTSLELEQAIARELAVNPALELRDLPQCAHCGAELLDGSCPACGSAGAELEERRIEQRDDYLVSDYDFSELGAGKEREDRITWLSSKVTLTDYVMRQARMGLPAAEVPIARYLVESLDDRGFLCCDPLEAASALSTQTELVEKVLTTVQSLEPPGIAARDARECLLIQLEHLSREGVRQPIAELLVREHWLVLGRCSLSRVAQEAGVSVDQARQALRFIRENLSPFPAYSFWDSRGGLPSGDEGTSPQPDVIIRESRLRDRDYEIELPKAHLTRLQVSASCREALDELGAGRSASDQRGWEQWERYRARARLFVRSVEQRWQTLYELARCLVAYQRGYLAHGERWLKPLTRARVAAMMEVHESTVCRAVAGKYALLPQGRIVPLSKFFDSAAPIKRMIEELVDQEAQPLTDQAIADWLSERGYDVARRTVAKYRNMLGILPSSLRRRSRDL